MKTIINNRSSMPDEDAVFYVMKVMEGGRISDGGYCFATVFGTRGSKEAIAVYAIKNKCSDTFTVMDA